MDLRSFAGNRACAAQSKSLTSVLTMIVCVFIWSGAAAAQVIIVQSTAKGLKAGTILQNNAKVSIPAGKKAVFVLPSGATRTVSGPFDGKASNLTKGVKANPGVFDAVKRLVQTGGTTSSTVGAVRSAAPAFSFGKPLPFSWRAVPITASGDFCVEKGAALSLVRGRSSKEQTATILEMKSQRRVQVVFPAGAKRIPWPDDLDLDPRATYAVLMKDRPMRRLRMRLIKPLPAREDTLQVLHGQRCDSQLRAFIREIQSAG